MLVRNRFEWLTRRVIVVGALLLMAAVILAFAITAAGGTDAATESAVHQAFAAAMTTQMTVLVPPGATPLTAGALATAPSAAQRLQQLKTGLAALAKYFTPAEASHEAIGLNNALAAEESPDFHVIAGGCSHITYKSVAVSGPKATVVATVTQWSRFQDRNPDGTWITSTPDNQVNITAQMMQDAAGNWQLDSFVSSFVPGSGP